ncbi:unnamed protein product [Adineta steineri]|uniref:AAA+ ATPase domain-containing protein n=1 Tax=Adineta steineri TaxID=433720 RepID=A0A814P5I9_9BILA|nr:unnamed protein product [Adineta steineri]
MGDHLWTILNHLEKLTKQYQRRIAYEQESGIRQEDANMFILDHLNIPVSDVVGAPLLQSDVNLEAIRGQCVLISGPSGCGKTSLFRICAGFQSIDAKQMILPARRHLLFIPQRPYLPHGSLRFQALFLVKDQNLENTSGWKLIVNIFKFIHLPFQSNDTKLIVETIIAWLLSLIMAGVNTWAFYTFIDRTAALYNGLTSYASGTISLTEAKQSIISDIASYIVIVVVVPTAYSLSAGGGRAHGLGSVTDDNYAQQLLNEFSLGHLIDRYSMNGKRQVWSELLSIGEQQRLMIVSALLIGTETARLLILDETTSGCDKQTEETIYKYLQRSNLQFISISHRKEISKYHSRQMTIDATDTPIPTPVFKTRF